MNEEKHVSVIIPCYNEENYIARCLNSIVNCDYNKQLLTILIAEGNSTDKSREIINKFCANYSYIHCLENKMRTTPFALNIGIKHKRADVYIILGAHSEIYPDHITLCVKNLFESKEIACVGGIIENISENETSKSISHAMSTILGVGNATFRTGGKRAYTDTVAFGAYKHEVFEICGYFDEELTRNQDDEFNYRITKKGLKILFDPAIKSKYYVRASFKKLSKQYYQYGYWKVYVNKKHGAITTIRQLAPAALVTGVVGGIILSALFHFLLVPYLSVLTLYILLITIFSLKTSSVIKTIYSYIILHFSYGLGYIEGIFHFLILNKRASGSKSEISR